MLWSLKSGVACVRNSMQRLFLLDIEAVVRREFVGVGRVKSWDAIKNFNKSSYNGKEFSLYLFY